MNFYLYAALIGGTAGMLWFWGQRGWTKIFQENHPFQALLGVFVLCGLGVAGTVWLIERLGFNLRAIGG
jgi:hypothetical protein